MATDGTRTKQNETNTWIKIINGSTKIYMGNILCLFMVYYVLIKPGSADCQYTSPKQYGNVGCTTFLPTHISRGLTNESGRIHGMNIKKHCQMTRQWVYIMLFITEHYEHVFKLSVNEKCDNSIHYLYILDIIFYSIFLHIQYQSPMLIFGKIYQSNRYL